MDNQVNRGDTSSPKLSPEKSVQAFMTQIADNKEALELFREQAQKRGFLGKQQPLIKQHVDYYDRYIKKGGGRNQERFDPYASLDSAFDRQQRRSMNNKSGKKGFIPLKDLLQKNHSDRVKDYLDKMKGLSIDDIVNNRVQIKTTEESPQKAMKSGGGSVDDDQLMSPKQQDMINQMRNKADMIEKNQRRDTQSGFDFTGALGSEKKMSQNLLKPGKVQQPGRLPSSDRKKQGTQINQVQAKTEFAAGPRISIDNVNDFMDAAQADKLHTKKTAAGDNNVLQVPTAAGAPEAKEEAKKVVVPKDKASGQKAKKGDKKKAEQNYTDVQRAQIKTHMRAILCKPANPDRFDKADLREFLEKHYDQKLGYALWRQLIKADYFDFANKSKIGDDDFITAILKLKNAEKAMQFQFVFECFDCFKNNDKITEENLFCFMNIFERFYDNFESTISWRGQTDDLKFISQFKKSGMPPKNKKDAKLLKLGEYVRDPFLDLFNEEFNKISAVLVAKRKKRIAQKELNEKIALGIINRDAPKDRKSSNKSIERMGSGLAGMKEPAATNADLLAKMADNMKRDDEDYLSKEEFEAIDFGHGEGERFVIINDLLEKFTGINHQSEKRSATKSPEMVESNEKLLNRITFAHRQNSGEEDFLAIQAALGNFTKLYSKLCRTFEKLWGLVPEHVIPGSEIDGIAVLTEKNFIQNIKHVIGVDCPFFGKMLYLYFSKGFHQAKVTSIQFMDGLKDFAKDENKQQMSKICFAIYDIDNDGQLNILNLLHLQQKLPPKSQIGREVFRLIYYLMQKNIYNKSSENKPVEINYEVFLKCLNYRTMLRDQIRLNFFGIQTSVKVMIENGVLATKGDDGNESEGEDWPIPPKKIQKLNQEIPTNSVFHDMSQEEIDAQELLLKDDVNFSLQNTLFKDVKVDDDISYGQRGFGNNQERLCQGLIDFYSSTWPKQHKQTMQRLEDEETEMNKQKKLLAEEKERERQKMIWAKVQKEAAEQRELLTKSTLTADEQ